MTTTCPPTCIPSARPGRDQPTASSPLSPAHDVLVPPTLGLLRSDLPNSRVQLVPAHRPTDGGCWERGSTACRPTARHSSRDGDTRRRGASGGGRRRSRFSVFMADGGRRRPVSNVRCCCGMLHRRALGCAPPWRNVTDPRSWTGRSGSEGWSSLRVCR